MNLYKRGKSDIKKYYELGLSKKSDFKSFILALPITAVIVLPILLILIQFFKLYYYEVMVRFFLGIAAWLLLLLCNGLSNMFMVKIAKRYYPENPTLSSLHDGAIFLYHTFEVFFAILTLILILYFGVVR